MNADESLIVPNRVAEAAKKVALPNTVVMAATRVCHDPAFLARLREQWLTLAFAAMADKQYGQKSNIGFVRDDIKVGVKKLTDVVEWLGQDARRTPLYLAYWRARQSNAEDEAPQQLLKNDMAAVERMLAYAQQDLAFLEVQPCTKSELLFPKTLAGIMYALTVHFSLPKPTLSDFGSEVKLMAALAVALGVNLSNEAARKALGKEMNQEQGNK